MTVKFPARVSLSYFLHSVLCDEVASILVEPAVEYLTLFKTCFKTVGRGLILQRRFVCLSKISMYLERMLFFIIKDCGKLEYCVPVDIRVIGFTQFKWRNPVCSVVVVCLFRHIDGL